jgi:hypothetical protein
VSPAAAPPLYLSGYGLIELPHECCVERLAGAEVAGRRLGLARDGETAADPRRGSRADAVRYLSHLTHPATRSVLFAVDDGWTCMLTNARGGSDFHDEQRWIGPRCRARSCRVVDEDGLTRRAGEIVARMRYPARIFELTDELGRSVRSVSCSLDGDRWDFNVSGVPLPAEAGFPYDARRKRDRFTSEHLHALLRSLGIQSPAREAFEHAERFTLLAMRIENGGWAADVEARACTPEQADDPGYGYLERGLGWVEHMRTHATSVVSDMTRAVLLNPELEAAARPHLDAARRQLGEEAFARIAGEVAEISRRRGV